MKKIILFIASVIIISSIAITAVACNDPITVDKAAFDLSPVDVDVNSAIFADSYDDYEKLASFPYEGNPELTSQFQGLAWTYWDEAAQIAKEIDADTQEGAALVNVDKPTIILVHGVQTDCGYNTNFYYTFPNWYTPSEYGQDGVDNIDMVKYYMDNGYNVGIFHYEKFADYSSVVQLPPACESKIWSVSSKYGSSYRMNDKSMSDDVLDYTLAEIFVGEMLRSFKMIDGFGKKDIQLFSHSMGGALSIVSTFLMTEMYKAGRCSVNQVPSILHLSDSYFGADGAQGLKCHVPSIRWSGKGLVNGAAGATYAECIKAIYNYGHTVVMFDSQDGGLTAAPADQDYLDAIKPYVCYTNFTMNYGVTNMTTRHNGVREWFMSTLVNGSGKVVTVDSGTGETTEVGKMPSAKDTALDLVKHVSNHYVIYSGNDTVASSDDLFELVVK